MIALWFILECPDLVTLSHVALNDKSIGTVRTSN